MRFTAPIKLIPLWARIGGVAFGVVLALGALGIHPIKSSVYIGLLFLLATLIPIHFRKLVPYRRDFGIVAGIYIVLHGMIAFNTVLNANIANALQKSILPGYIGSIILMILLVTSNYVIQRALGVRWRAIHAFVWFALPISLAHTIWASEAYTGDIAVVGSALLGAMIIFGFLKPFFAPGARKEHLRDTILIVLGICVAWLIACVFLV